jgi:hypothetical protein
VPSFFTTNVGAAGVLHKLEYLIRLRNLVTRIPVKEASPRREGRCCCYCPGSERVAAGGGPDQRRVCC